MSDQESDVPAWITCEYLENTLQTFFGDDCLQVENFSVKPASSEGDNYTCQLFRIKIDYSRQDQKKSRSLIAKVLPDREMAKSLTKGYDMYQREIKMFTETLPLLHEELLKKSETERFFPYLYNMGKENQSTVLFMEDLAAEGYVLADRRSSLGLDHALLVVKALAKMHASSYLLLQKNPDYKERHWDCEFRKTNHGVMELFTTAALHYTLKSLHLWPISEEDKNIFRSFQGNVYERLCNSCERKESGFNVLIHGDCWVNNIMFKYLEKSVASAKLIDYQFSHYNSIGLDFNYFLFTSAKLYVLSEDHLEDVFQVYYDTFVDITGEIPEFTVDKVREEFYEKLEFGFLVGLIFRCVITAEKPFDVEAVLENRESDTNTEIFQNKEYILEAVKFLQFFKEHGIFKL